MATLPDNSVDMVLTDPPYFKVKGEAWDRQWDKPNQFLSWLDQCAEQWARVLKPNGSLYCFASPQMAARVEVKFSERLNVLNHLVWSKTTGRWKASSKESLRGFFPSTERIIFCEHYGADNIAKGEAGYAAKCDELRGFVFEPLRAYLAGERDRAGFTTRGVAEAFQRKTGSRTVTGMAGHWFERVQWCLPTEGNYRWLRELLNTKGDFEQIKRREYEDLRRPFSVTADVPYTDVWTFEPVRAYKGKHPCEKPQDMLGHMIESSTRPGAVVLDSFMGTGSAGVACKNLGRSFIGIELDPDYFRIAQERMASDT
jgi:site-specific DNA-methyltransferase (adenine-specific)